MKKTIKLLLVMVMMITLVGCGNSNNGNISGNDSIDTLIKNFDKKAKVSSTTIYSGNNVEIELTDFSISDERVELEFDFTNNTDEELEFLSGSTGYSVNSINGYMINDGYVSVDVEPGETESDTMYIDLRNLIANGIMKIADISVGFNIDASDYDSDFDEFYTGAVNLKTSLADSYDYSENVYQNFMKKGFEKAFDAKVLYFSDKQLLNNSGIEVNSFAVVKTDDKIAGLLEIKNTNSDEVQSWATDVYINDEEIDTYTWNQTINEKSTAVVVFDISEFLEDYEGSADLSTLNKFKFTLKTGETSYSADTTDEIEIDLSKEKVSLK